MCVRNRSLLLALLLAVLAGRMTGVSYAQTREAQEAARVFTLVNEDREAAGLVRLRWDPRLAQAAASYAAVMANHPSEYDNVTLTGSMRLPERGTCNVVARFSNGATSLGPDRVLRETWHVDWTIGMAAPIRRVPGAPAGQKRWRRG